MNYAIQILQRRRSEIEKIKFHLPIWSRDFKLLKQKADDIDEAIRAIEAEHIVKYRKLSPPENQVFRYVKKVQVYRSGNLIHTKEYNREMTEERMSHVMRDLSALFQVPFNHIGFEWEEMLKIKNENRV